MTNTINWNLYRYDLDKAKILEWDNERLFFELERANTFIELVNETLYKRKIVGWARHVLGNLNWAEKTVHDIEELLKKKGLMERNENEFVWDDED